jgi:hypothetical protein
VVGARAGVAGLVTLLLLLAAACGGGGDGARPADRALVIGDSLVLESAVPLQRQVERHDGWAASVHAYGGSAPCDWISWLPDDLASFHPTIVGISTVGNWYPSACMTGIAPNSPEFWAKYRADLSTLIGLVKEAGAHVVLFTPPPMRGATRNAISKQMVVELEALAAKHHVAVANGTRTVLGGATYMPVQPCRPDETATMGCHDGTIAVRTQPPAPDAGLHLCPTGLLLATDFRCASYSSGEVRFAEAVTRALLSAERSPGTGPSEHHCTIVMRVTDCTLQPVTPSS